RDPSSEIFLGVLLLGRSIVLPCRTHTSRQCCLTPLCMESSIVKRILFAVGALFALLGSMLVHPLPAHAQTGFHISNGRLVDASGNDFVMRGASHAHTWFTEQTQALADSKSLGANTVRVVLSSGDYGDEDS